MLNFIVVIMCISIAIWDFHEEFFGWGILQIALAFINLPFAIKWLITMF